MGFITKPKFMSKTRGTCIYFVIEMKHPSTKLDKHVVGKIKSNSWMFPPCLYLFYKILNSSIICLLHSFIKTSLCLVSACSHVNPCYPGRCYGHNCACSYGFGGNSCLTCKYCVWYFNRYIYRLFKVLLINSCFILPLESFQTILIRTDIIQLMTFDKVDTMIYQPRRSDNGRG